MCFVEYLTLRTWCLVVLPRVLWQRLRGRRLLAPCYVFEASGIALALARVAAPLTGVRVEPLRYRMIDVRDEEGLLLRLRVAYQDLAEVQAEAMQHPAFQGTVKSASPDTRLPAFLAKAIATIGFSERGRLWRALMTIQVCVWKQRQGRGAGGAPVVFLERLPWLEAITRYAARYGVWIIPTPPVFHLGRELRSRLPFRLRVWLRFAKARWAAGAGHDAPAPVGVQQTPPGCARLAVDYYGHLNLDHPERYSDLFFWQQSSVSAQDLLVAFMLARDPLDERKYAELSAHGIDAVALQPHARTITTAPLFVHDPRRDPTRTYPTAWRHRSAEADWLNAQVQDYASTRAFWEQVFARYQVKVYVSWFKYDASHHPLADALQSLGGVTAFYQRAYEPNPSAETATAVDLFFGWSRASAEVEQHSNSTIPYYVITGYLGDHRAPLWREEAQRLRQRLHQHGATRIVAFTDENSKADDRWHTGNRFMQENYVFLLEQVLAQPWLGLVIKPKVPASLRQRLGPVATLLQRAESTGRCYVFERGTLHGSYPPVAAALASDLMVHGHLCAATAGIEAMLAGVPTLLMDREGWSRSPLYRLGVGRVVFTDWQALWKVCLEQWSRPDGLPGFGDWSSLLDELDPFRDGRAAERMGTYLQWLLEGFKAGLSRETVLADAAERYGDLWGKEKVVQMCTEAQRDHAPEERLAVGRGDASWASARQPVGA